MRILIITSELLNPKNTLSSTFELTQAQILSKEHDVCVISVYQSKSFVSLARTFLKRLIFSVRDGFHTFKQDLQQLLSMGRSLILRKKFVREHLIENVRVYEGVRFFFRTNDSFFNDLNIWVGTGLLAFESYMTENGKPDLVHAHGRFLNAGALALAIKKIAGQRYVYTEHSTYYQRGLAPPESRTILDEVLTNASLFIAVSESLLHHVQQFLGKKINSSLILPNVIDGVFEQPLTRNSSPHRGVTFINIASFDHKKGLDLLIRAFKEAFDGDMSYTLNICGDGMLRDELTGLRNSLGLEKQICFLGIKTKYEVKEYLDDAQAFVLSSRVETFGVAVIEALARGLPVIATRSGGPEYILKDYCGILVESEDVKKLSDALKQMAANYLTYNSELIRQFALETYGTESFLKRMSTIYKSVVNDLHS